MFFKSHILFAMLLEFAFAHTIQLHVTGVSHRYKTIQFTDGGSKVRKYTLSPDETDSKNIQVTDGNIDEMKLDLEFPVKIATILKSSVAKSITVWFTAALCDLQLQENCLTHNAYNHESTIFVKGVDISQSTMVCMANSDKSPASTTFTLIHGSKKIAKGETRVVHGVISSGKLILGLIPKECTVLEGPALEAIELQDTLKCARGGPQKCFKNLGLQI